MKFKKPNTFIIQILLILLITNPPPQELFWGSLQTSTHRYSFPNKHFTRWANASWKLQQKQQQRPSTEVSSHKSKWQNTHTLGLSDSPVGILKGSFALPASAVVRDDGRRWPGSQAAATAEKGSIWHWPTLAPRLTSDLQPQEPVEGWSSVF